MGETEVHMKEKVGDVHSCIYRTPTNSFMYLSSLATWRTANLLSHFTDWTLQLSKGCPLARVTSDQ